MRRLTPDRWGALAQAALLIPTISLLLRRRGLTNTAQLLAGRSERGSIPPDLRVAVRTAESVDFIARRRPLRSRCLTRSLTLWFLLRRKGIDADLLIGAAASSGRVLPAHSWVEVDGIPVNDSPDVNDRFGSFGIEFPRLARSQSTA